MAKSGTVVLEYMLKKVVRLELKMDYSVFVKL